MARDEVLERRLLRMKNEIEELRTARDQAQGRLDASMDRLKNDFGCSSVEEAEKQLEKKEKQLVKERATLEKMVTELEGKFGWEGE